jgi:DNA repair exonuclease SbcCD nuclease subunit
VVLFALAVSMKFIHCADVHLDSPLVGLSRYPEAPAEAIRLATRRAFQNIVGLAIAEQADFVVIAGDLYDTGLQGYDSALFFNAQVSLLQKAGIGVYLAYGNHDAASRLDRNVRLPLNVRVFSPDQPETVTDEKLGVALHGQSYDRAAVTRDLAANYPSPVPGLFNLGILHSNVAGVSENHQNYAPCSLQTLANKGYDYWALGHVHARKILNEEPWVVYSGNTQGRHVRETGEKTCELVTVGQDHKVNVEAVPVSVVLWQLAEVDITSARSLDDACDLAQASLAKIAEECNGRTVAVRVCLRGACEAHEQMVNDVDRVRNEIRARGQQTAGDEMWIERVQIESRPIVDVEDLIRAGGPVAEVIQTVRDLVQNPAGLIGGAEDLNTLADRLPADFASLPDAPRLKDPDYLTRILRDAESAIISRLSVTEES